VARFALLLLALLLAAAYWLQGRAPASEATGLGEGTFEGVEFWLFPKADPEARWRLYAPLVRYDAARRVAEARGEVRGERLVGEEVDLELSAKEVVIDQNDNLITPEAEITLPKECWRLYLKGDGRRQVRIDQRYGYTAPEFELEGPGVKVEGRGFSSDFGLTNARWRSGREEWREDEATACDH